MSWNIRLISSKVNSIIIIGVGNNNVKFTCNGAKIDFQIALFYKVSQKSTAEIRTPAQDKENKGKGEIIFYFLHHGK